MRRAPSHPVSTSPSLARRAAAVLPLVLALGATACGGAAAKPGNFPTREDLQQLAGAPPPKRVFDQNSVDVDSWELIGPLPDAIDGALAEDTDPWSKLLAGAAAAKPGLVVTSRAMACTARQVAAFVAEKDANPAAPLLRFMAARCGVPSGSIGTSYLSGEVPESTSDADLYSKWEAQMKDGLASTIGPGNRLAGISYSRKGKRAAVAIVTAARLAHVETVPLAPTDGKVFLRGELLNPAESIRAIVTRGRFGYELCIKDIEVVLPRFAIECPLSADDPTARVEVAAFPPGRELGDTALDVQVFPAGTLLQSYSRSAAGAAAPPGDAALGSALLDQINAVRKEAGLGAVRLSDAQSRTAAQLAPYYFAALSGGAEPTFADKVALGLLAGWDVDGMVREGHFTSQWSHHREPGALIEAAIASPFGRETLLDPAISLIAIGPVAPKESAVLGAVFSTYALLDTSGKTDNTSAVLARLSKLRAKIKRPAPEAAPELDALLSDIAARVEGGLSLDEALERLTKKSLETISRGRVKAWVATASSVDRLEFPSDLLARSGLHLGVVVARYRPQGAPWTKLAVFFVDVDESPPLNTARAAGAHSG